jgi:hypothetical protein
MRGALSSILMALLVAAAGCAQKKVRVEMQASNEGVDRSFASNALDEEAQRRLSDIYAAPPQGDSTTGGVRFDGRFDGHAGSALGAGIPSELGNRNGLTERRSPVGSAWFYFESFDGTSRSARAGEETAAAEGIAPAEDSDWATLQRRMAAGELWVRLFGRWAEQSIDDPARQQEFRVWIDDRLVPFANDFMLRYGAMQAVAQSARIGGRIRDRGERGPRSEDESFYMRVFLPLLLELGSEGGVEPDAATAGGGDGSGALFGARAVTAGLFTAEELHQLLLVSLDGNAGGRAREWSLERVLLPAVNRHVQRWTPGAKPLTATQITIAGLGFLLWVGGSPQRDEILLESPAISAQDKERLRAGDRSITLPSPYGADPRSRPDSVEAEVRLKVADAPYLTNGVWSAERGEILFSSRFFPGEERTVLFQPIYYAAWTAPDAARQRAIFGEVILRGEALAQFIGWREVMTESRRKELDAALLAAADGDPRTLQRLLSQGSAMRDAPPALRRWVERRGGNAPRSGAEDAES